METRKTSELLKEAYQYLWSPELETYETASLPNFLCLALDKVKVRIRQNSWELAKIDKARVRINDYLWQKNRCATFKCLYRIDCPEIYYSAIPGFWNIWIQRRRREFLCNLISQYEHEGD